jgi:hypothetical protein
MAGSLVDFCDFLRLLLRVLQLLLLLSVLEEPLRPHWTWGTWEPSLL